MSYKAKNNGNGSKSEDSQDILTQTVEITSTTHRLIHESELDNLPPTKWLIEELIPEGKLCVLFGSPGSGKSFYALDIALNVAQKHSVIYIAAEGFSGFAKRKNAWYKHHKKSPGQLFFSADPLLLMDESNVESFIDTAGQVTPALIVIDTLAWCMTGGDENSARDMQIVIAACRTIQQQTGAAILLVHHTTKRGTSERGSSVIRGSADVMIELTNEDGLMTISCSKSKDTEPFETHHHRLMKVDTPQGQSCVVMDADKIIDSNELTTSQKDILEQLSLEIFDDVGMRSQQIIGAIDLAPSTTYRVLTQLKKKGLIRQHKRGDPFYITDKGRVAIRAG